MIGMEGNKTQVIILDGDHGSERTRDSYGIEGITFSSLHVPNLLQVEPRLASELIKIHL